VKQHQALSYAVGIGQAAPGCAPTRPVSGVMAQRPSGYARKPDELYETPSWVAEVFVPHLPRRPKCLEARESATEAVRVHAAARRGDGQRCPRSAEEVRVPRSLVEIAQTATKVAEVSATKHWRLWRRLRLRRKSVAMVAAGISERNTACNSRSI